jgi:hypothetical protein
MSDVLERATIQRAMEVSGRLTGQDDWREIAVAIDAAVLAEREACAKIAEKRLGIGESGGFASGVRAVGADIAHEIRARGGK